MKPGSQNFFRLTKPLLFTLCFLPFAHAALGAFGLLGISLGANPVEAIMDSFGIWGLRILLVGLAITPLQQVLRKPWLIRYRRMLGLFAAFYIFMHFLTYAWLDQQFDLVAIGEDILKRPFITIGMAALVLLVPLAVTSTKGWMRRLGQRWKKLHWLVYPITLLGVWHYYWQVKLDALEPTVYAAILGGLLGYRWWKHRQRAARRRAKAADGARRGFVDQGESSA